MLRLLNSILVTVKCYFIAVKSSIALKYIFKSIINLQKILKK